MVCNWGLTWIAGLSLWKLFTWCCFILLISQAPPPVVLMHCYTCNTFSYQVYTGTYLKSANVCFANRWEKVVMLINCTNSSSWLMSLSMGGPPLISPCFLSFHISSISHTGLCHVDESDVVMLLSLWQAA